ncbi:MAG: signal peptidase I, partial [Patescibacteria group bacterium]
IIRTYVVQPFLVSGQSMEPNFQGGNYLLIDEVSYRFEKPKREDVIVFRYPGDEKTFYIKRIIGIPEDQVVVDNGRVSINGKILDEDYLADDARTVGNINKKLGPDEYFVMGDNRDYSFDSRQWGVLPQENIIGVVRLRLFPLNKIQIYAQ